MAIILGVGIATLDIINVVETYPHEDDEVRALQQYKVRGGNVTNTLSVLTQFKHRCYWAGSACNEPDAQPIYADLDKRGIDYRYVQIFPYGKVPTSYVTLSAATGSRTVVHYRNLPEFDFESFKKIPLEQVNWVHFEGRNVLETRRMMELADVAGRSYKISLEIEKPRPEIETLIPFADVVIFSKRYVRHLGFSSAEAFLTSRTTQGGQADLFCAWGNAGAYALPQSAKDVIHCPAVGIPKVVDTLGAGDTFNAGIIHSLNNGKSISEALEFATQLASKKCAQTGFDGLYSEAV